jgi:hypothetical protein
MRGRRCERYCACIGDPVPPKSKLLQRFVCLEHLGEALGGFISQGWELLS